MDPDVPLSYAIAHEATHVYFEQVSRHAITGMFFARFPETVTPSMPLVSYMGLTVVDRCRATPACSRRLWSQFLHDVRDFAGVGVNVLVWYRTATPFGLYPAQALLRDGIPKRKGALPGDALGLVREIRRAFFIPENDATEHPFVVRGYARARYNESETAFIARYRQANGDDLLSGLRIREEKGDRLLLLGYVP